MLTSLLLTFVLYLAPGWIVLNLFSVKKAPFWKRLFPALALSFISVPFFFLAVGNIIPLRAATLPGGLWLPLGVFAAVGIIVGWILKRRGRLIAVELAPAEATVSKWEKWAIWIFLILFTTIVNLPRLEMFLAGGQSGMIPLWDENWHLAELVSVARSGIPPQHYYFPTLHLAYYYGAWILPAVLGNPLGNGWLGTLAVPLERTMAIHAWLTTFIFLGLFYLLLQRWAHRRSSRIIGIAFITVMGGFDLYASLPVIQQVDWWQKQANWLIPGQQISQWVTMYTWVPQHIAAAVLFLAVLFVWRYMQVEPALKWLAIGGMAGLGFVFSPFVTLGGGLALLLVLIWEWRNLWDAWRKAPKQITAYFLLFSLMALLPSWHSIWVYPQHETALGWNTWRVPVLELLRGSNAAWQPADRLLVLIGFPLTVGWVTAIEIGLPFLIFAAWWMYRLAKTTPLFASSLEAMLGWQPVLFLFLTILL